MQSVKISTSSADCLWKMMKEIELILSFSQRGDQSYSVLVRGLAG